MTIFKVLEQSGWSFHAGDPDVMGWTIFFGYIAISLFCLYVGIVMRRMELRGEKKSEYGMWFVTSLFLFLLAVNKQLDLQVLMTASGRALAHMQGWYSFRREVQMFFFSVFALCAVWMLWRGFNRFRVHLRENILLCVGLGLLAAFVLISAATDTNIVKIPDSIRIIGAVNMKNVIELSGILLVGVSALQAVLRVRRCTQDYSE